MFMGKARCGTCHFAPLFNGTEPPSYLTTDPEIIGVPERVALDHAQIDPDPGRAAIDRVPSHGYAFKVPTVRNAAVTERASFGPTLIMTCARTAPKPCSGASRTP